VFAWVALAVVGGVVAAAGGRLANGGTDVPGSQSARTDALEADRIFGEDRTHVFVVVSVPEGRASSLAPLLPRVRKAVAAAPHVAEVGQGAVVSRANFAIFAFDLGSTLVDAQDQLADVRTAAKRAAGQADVTIVGEAADYDRYGTIARDDLDRVEKISFPVTSAIILVAFLSIVATGVPTVLAGLVLAVTFGLLFAISQLTTLSVFASNTALGLGLGLSIDYSLFNVTRYREALRENGGSIPDAVRETVSTTGRAVVFSGLTIITATASLFLLQVGVFSGMAIGVIAAALVAALGGVTLVPAVLVLAGRHLDRLALRRVATAAESGRAWKRLAAFVLRRRLPVAVGAATALALLTIPLLHAPLASPTASALPKNDRVRVVSERVGRVFGGGAVTPVQVVARGNRKRVAQALERDPGVGRPIVIRPGKDGWLLLLAPLLDNGDSPAAQETVRRLRRKLTEGDAPAAAAVGGTTAKAVDLLDRLHDRTPAVVATALLLSATLLLFAFRSIVVPIKAALTTLLSVGAALGILTLLYHDLGIGESDRLSFFVPLFLFAIIFGLSADYEVFLLSRIREEYLSGASSDRSIERGLVASARAITLAGLVMVAVFLAQASSRMEPLQQLGLGMAIAVLIDITIVRTFLVPATMALLGRANWWLPGRRNRGQ
jgi:RND superfamily putative drug exporter